MTQTPHSADASWSRRLTLLPWISLASLLTGCVAYRPAPIDRSLFVQQYDTAGPSLPVTQPLAENDLLSYGVAHAPALHAAAAAYRVASAAARSSRVRPLGTLSLTAEYSHQDNPNKPWLGTGALSVPLDMGARRSGRIGSADLAVLQARYDYIEALWAMRTVIRRGLIELRAADAESAEDRDAVAVRQDREARLDRRVDTGEDARSIALLARSERLAAERRLADAQARRLQALETIGSAIGLRGSAQAGHVLAPATDLPDPAPAEIATWRSEAALARPDVLRAVADYDIAEAAVRTEVAKQYPDIQIGPGYTYERGITKLPFTLSLALPPADFNRAAIREAEARRTAAGSKLETAQANVLSATDAAAAALAISAQNQARALQRDVPSALRAFDQVRRSTDAGETDRTDELGARATLIDARIAAIDTRRIHDLARADLEAAARPPLDAQQTALFDQAIRNLEP